MTAELNIDTLWEIHGVVNNAGSTSLAHKIADAIAQARLAAPVAAQADTTEPAARIVADHAGEVSALAPAVIALDAAIHKVLIAGGDYGDELSDHGLRNALKDAQHIAYRALISVGIEQLPGAVNPLRAFLPKNRTHAISAGEADTTASVSAAAQAVEACNLLNAEELAALRRFDECAQDGEGYDVPKEMMHRLAEIGVVRRRSGAYYQATEFGQRVLGAAAAPAEQAAQQLTDAERDFVARVKAVPGAKLDWDSATHEGQPLWRRPEALGLIRCVGSYKWEPAPRKEE